MPTMSRVREIYLWWRLAIALKRAARAINEWTEAVEHAYQIHS
jgi:hypothetical protein